MDSLEPQNVLQFLDMVHKLKHTTRSGWEQFNIASPERVSGHMYAMAMMTFLIDDKSPLDKHKCMKLALVHDLAECIVGDITPRDNVPEDIKHRMEREAMEKITSFLGDKVGNDMLELYKEYERKETAEAKFVKDLDRLDMIFTAHAYEKSENSPNRLQEFFTSTDGKFQHPFVKRLVEELYKERTKAGDEPSGS